MTETALKKFTDVVRESAAALIAKIDAGQLHFKNGVDMTAIVRADAVQRLAECEKRG